MKNSKHILLLSPLCCLVIAFLASHGCANTSQAPTGGPKDTIAPVLREVIPPDNSVNVSTQRVEVRFDEFMKITDANTQILLSPPQSKKPTARTKGKGVLVLFEYPLDSNTTYCLYFGNALADNNEGNPFPNFATSFSTGQHIDSLMLSGLVVDAYTMLPKYGATVVLHKHVADTTLEKTLPVAVTRTDDWGYFCFRNLTDTTYQIFVFEDDNNDYKYAPDNDYISFHKDSVHPVKIMMPTSKELKAFDPKDTLGLLSRPIDVTLYTFKGSSTRQVLKERTRNQERQIALKFGAPDAQIISFQVEGVDSSAFIIQSNPARDSILYWINAHRLPDTLKCILRYMRTNDSLKILEPAADTFKLKPIPRDSSALQDNKSGNNRTGRNKDNSGESGPPAPPKRKDLLEVSLTATDQKVEQEGISLKFPSYPIHVDLSGATMFHVGTKKDTIFDPLTVTKDYFDPLLYHIHTKQWLKATEYNLSIPPKCLRDINGFTNDSLSTKFSTPDPDKFSQLTINAIGTKSPCIIDLMDENRSKVIRSYWIERDTILSFPYLQPGKVCIRIIEDSNSNRLWDIGSYKERRPAERVRMYRLPDKKEVIEIKENIDFEQTLDIQKTLNQDVTLTPPAKGSGTSKRR